MHYKVFSLQAEEMEYLVYKTYTGLTKYSQTIASGNQDGKHNTIYTIFEPHEHSDIARFSAYKQKKY
jgi:hypothetical protein